jgi:membrane fusion protein (multidrug efflux system)
VMEVVGNVAHERKIEAGVRNGDKVQIASGIKAGANVVTNGGVGLQDGAKVEAKKAGEEDKDEKKSPVVDKKAGAAAEKDKAGKK